MAGLPTPIKPSLPTPLVPFRGFGLRRTQDIVAAGPLGAQRIESSLKDTIITMQAKAGK